MRVLIKLFQNYLVQLTEINKKYAPLFRRGNIKFIS